MAFAGPRGWHRMACAIEDAGFILHPTIFCWATSQGFPKAKRVDTKVDKAAGAKREVVGTRYRGTTWRHDGRNGTSGKPGKGNGSGLTDITAPATPLARAWAGYCYGQQTLKPSADPIIVAQKPYEGRPIDCIARTGAGAFNVDGGRIPHDERCSVTVNGTKVDIRDPKGRWPSNLILMDGESAQRMDLQGGNDCSRFFYNVSEAIDEADPVFYCPKASHEERDAGCGHLPMRCYATQRPPYGDPEVVPMESRNPHPTLKPLDLCRYLATLLLPPAEYSPRRMLVPFSGSGSEMVGAALAGWDEVVGIESDVDYVEIARSRLSYHLSKMATGDGPSQEVGSPIVGVERKKRGRRKRGPDTSQELFMFTKGPDPDVSGNGSGR